MTDVSDYLANNVLNYSTGKTAMPTLPTVYVALLTSMATGGTSAGEVEVSGGGYARVATSGAVWGAAAGSVPCNASNSAVITFPQSTAGWGTIIGFRLFDAASSGNRLMGGWLGAGLWKPFTCSLASPGIFTVPAHGFSNGDSVVVTNEFGGTLPTQGGSWNSVFTVANVTTDTFTIGVNTTSSGMGMVRKIAPYILSSANTSLSFPIGALTLTMG